MLNRKRTDLIARARERDPDAFTELMQMYMKDMYRVAVAILMQDDDAADAVQDTILTCWEKLSVLREDRFFKTWMTRILIHKCYDIRKTREKITRISKTMRSRLLRIPVIWNLKKHWQDWTGNTGYALSCITAKATGSGRLRICCSCL